MNEKIKLVVLDNEQQIEDFLIRKWKTGCLRAIQERGYSSVALSGGKTPLEFYGRLAASLGTSLWDKTHVFLVDERFVSFRSKDSNYGNISKQLFSSANVPEENMHPVYIKATARQSAEYYERELLNFFRLKAKQIPVFDFVFLGIGADGHTASLFPKAGALKEKKRLVINVKTPQAAYERITMTLPVINNARNIIFIVTGKGKAKVMRRLLKDKDKTLPAALVSPKKGNAFFVLDQKAASLLGNK